MPLCFWNSFRMLLVKKPIKTKDMKISKIILSGIFATAMLGTTSAFASNNLETIKIVLDDEAVKPTAMKIEELPEAIQQAIKVNAYHAERAYFLYKGDEKVYQVDVSKEGEKSTLYFHEDGKACDMKK